MLLKFKLIQDINNQLYHMDISQYDSAQLDEIVGIFLNMLV